MGQGNRLGVDILAYEAEQSLKSKTREVRARDILATALKETGISPESVDEHTKIKAMVEIQKRLDANGGKWTEGYALTTPITPNTGGIIRVNIPENPNGADSERGPFKSRLPHCLRTGNTGAGNAAGGITGK